MSRMRENWHKGVVSPRLMVKFEIFQRKPNDFTGQGEEAWKRERFASLRLNIIENKRGWKVSAMIQGGLELCYERKIP